MVNASYITAFLFGVLAFFSACTFPLVPSFLAFLAGSTVKELGEGAYTKEKRNRLLFSALLYVLGSCVMLVLLGGIAGSAGFLFHTHRDILERIGGVIVILFGTYTLAGQGLFSINTFFSGLSNRITVKIRKRVKVPRYIFAFLLGLIFSIFWAPCLSPVLGTILILASNTGTFLYGSSLLFSYALGLNILFLLFAIGFSTILGYMSLLRKYVRIFTLISGSFMLLLGFTMLLGLFDRLNGSLYLFAQMLHW